MFGGRYRIIDLSLEIYEGMTTGGYGETLHPRTEITVMGRHFLEGRASRKLILGSHTGTHVDAPLHQIADGSTMEKLPLESLVGEAAVVDLSPRHPLEPITAEDLEAKGSAVREGDIVILRTDWWKRWDTWGFYSEHPYLTDEACEWLLERRVRAIVMDFDLGNPTIKRPPATPEPQHVKLMSRGVVLIENPTRLDQLTKDRVFIIALPLKVRGSDGAPGRVIALEEVEEDSR